MSHAVFLQSVQKTYGSSDDLLNRIPARTAGRFLKLAGTDRDGHATMPHPAAVHDVSFAVPEGEIFGVLGPVASGKTTLIRLIAGLLQPDYGRIEVFGYDVTRHAGRLRPLINQVAFDGSFFRKRSILENLLSGEAAAGTRRAAALQQAIDLLCKLGLDESTMHASMENVPPSVQRRVSLARAILARPRLLLLDEPTAGLLPDERRAVWSLLRELRREGVTILLATEDPEEARLVCDHLVILEGGRVVAAGVPAELLVPAAGFGPDCPAPLCETPARANVYGRLPPGPGCLACVEPLSRERKLFQMAAAYRPEPSRLGEPN